jgi:hypothetical protein
LKIKKVIYTALLLIAWIETQRVMRPTLDDLNKNKETRNGTKSI